MKYVKYLVSVFVAAVIFAGVLLWVLSMTMDNFEWFKTYYLVYIFAGGLGIASFIYMLPLKNRMFGYIGAVLFIPVIIVAFIKGDIALGVPFIVLMFAGLFLIFKIFGIRKWDAGENQKLGYKTYAQRKAEEEAKEKKELESQEKQRQKAKNAAMSRAAAEAAARAEMEFEEKNKKK